MSEDPEGVKCSIMLSFWRKIHIILLVLTNLVNSNFAWHDFFQELKVALTKELVY